MAAAQAFSMPATVFWKMKFQQAEMTLPLELFNAEYQPSKQNKVTHVPFTSICNSFFQPIHVQPTNCLLYTSRCV